MKLTVREAARVLNVPENVIYRWVGEGSIPVSRVGGQIRFNRAELLEWATSRQIAVSSELTRDPDQDEGPLPRLIDAVTRGGIHHQVPGSDRESVLRGVINLMPMPDNVDREFVYQVFLARESLGSTAVGDGIAIPHVRNPIVLHIPEPCVMLCFLQQPIDFHAADRQPVHTLFTLVTPTMRQHLHLLSRIALSLRDPGFKALLKRQGGREEILREARRLEDAAAGPAGSGAEVGA